MQTRIVAAARAWIGTPYHHQASARGLGCDCLGLLRGVWREVVGPEPETPHAYSWDWAEATGEETLRDAAARHLGAVALDAWQPGDVLVFRMSRSGPAKHCGIATSGVSGLGGSAAGGHMVHAWSGHAVAEVPLGVYWTRRLANAFRFQKA